MSTDNTASREEISETTTDVPLDPAAFAPANIRKTSKELGLASDSSYRFERGVDIEMVAYASARAAALICELAGGTLARGMIDVREGPWVAPEVDCRFDRVNALIGLDIPAVEIKRLLTALGLEVTAQTESGCRLAIPPYRPDLTREADLVEEVARLHGYDRIPAHVPGGQVGGPIARDDYYAEQEIRQALLGLGLDECLHIATISEDEATAATGFNAGELVRISNPLGREYGVLRPSLAPDLLRVVAHNIAHDNHDLRLFEMGRVFCRRADVAEERLACGIVLSGRRHPERFSAELEETMDFYDLSGLVDDLFEALHLGTPTKVPAEHPLLTPGQTAELWLDDVTVGVCGRVRDEHTARMRRRHEVFAALLQLDRVLDRLNPAVQYGGLSPFPATARDVAFIADRSLSHREVIEAIRSSDVKILEDVQLFDIFEGDDTVGQGRKSMAYRMTFRSPERTLKDKEVNRAHDKIKNLLTAKLNIELRG